MMGLIDSTLLPLGADASILSSQGSDLLYLIASIFFVLGIKGLTHPRTAVRGNLYGALGMLIAILDTPSTWG